MLEYRIVRNFIFSNGEDGVDVALDEEIRNRILSNSIHSNGGQGIDLANDGVTPNDQGDVDIGPNDLQNKPSIASATNSAAKTTIKGTLRTKSNRSFLVSFFSNPSGTDEGKNFIGQRAVRTDPDGKATFTFSPAQRVGAGKTITATATGSEGTSEFSSPLAVVAQ
jgi:titin